MTIFRNSPGRRSTKTGNMVSAVFLGIAMMVLALLAIGQISSPNLGMTQVQAALAPDGNGTTQTRGGSAAIPTSTDLADFLVSATFDAPQNDSGQYVVTPGTTYEFRLSFQERYGHGDTLQFPDSATMTYGIPEGLAVADGHEGKFTIKIKDGTETYPITDNAYAIRNSVLSVNFNTSHPNFGKLTATANTRFTLEFQGTFAEDAETIIFSDDIVRNLTVDRTNSVTASKSARFDKERNAVDYTVTIHSLGHSTDVHVKDVLTGPALTLDASSIGATSSTGQPVEMTGGVQGNSFEYVIPSMANNEFVTFTYSATVDPALIQAVNGNYATVGNNAVETWSTDDPTPDRREVSTTIDYTPTLAKSNGTVIAENGNIKTMIWTIEANQLPQVSMAGTTITDTIGLASQPIMRYSGNGLTIVVKDASGSVVRTDEVGWDQLPSKTDSTWSYIVPGSDEGHAYSYTISYTTDVDLTGKTSVTTVTNDASSSGGSSASGNGQGVPTGGEVLVHKEATRVDLASKEITWNISFNVPADGLDVATVTDTYPFAYDSDGITCFRDRAKDGSVTVTGLVEGETYDVAYGPTATVITFYKDAGKAATGLQAGSARSVSVTLTTEMDQAWLEASKDYKTDPGRGALPTHTNTVQLLANSDYKIGSASTVVTLPEVAKTSSMVGTRIVNGIELPIYQYEIVVTGVNSDVIEIEDKFDTDLLMYYDSDYPDRGYVYGGTVHWQGTQGGHFNRLDTVDGMIISTDASNLPHDATGGYFAGYRFVYYLTVKDVAALNTIKTRAAAADDGIYAIGNEVRFQDSTASADVTYEYDGLKKEILTSDNELKKVDDDIWADFRITLNGDGMLLNGGEDLTMTDTVSNLSVDVTSIQATPSAGVSWDMTGNTVTYTIPDGVPIVITYRARVIMTSIGENGDTLHIDFSNHAEMKGYKEDINKTAERTNNGGGTGSIASINILKYRAGDMTQTLAGARFQLQDSNEEPVLDKDGNPVEFTTGADGKINIKGNMQDLGWVIEDDDVYYLEEKLAPSGFMLAGHKYQFTVSSDGTTDYGQYIYYSGDTMTVKDYPGTDVRVMKVWSDGNESHESDEVVVRLQQSIDGGDWSDTIRCENEDGDWVDVPDMSVALNASNGWEAMFNGLPLMVPRDIADSQANNDASVDYRVVEISVNNTPLAEGIFGTGGLVEGSGTYVYTVTNTVGEDTGDLTVTKSVQSDDAADHETDFAFIVTLKGADDATATDIAGTYGDMEFVAGTAMFTLKDGESKTATGLPQGIAYTVTETPVDGFITTVGSDVTSTATGTISGTESAVTFVNAREEVETGGLTVTKKVSSHTTADKGALYAFTVKLDDETINGQYGEMAFEDGEARFSLTDRGICDEDGKSTGTKTAEGLPVGIKYTVTETVPDGFTVTSTGEVGTIVAGTAPEGTEPTYPVAEFVNTRDEGKLAVRKTVVGATSVNDDAEYTIAVVLKNADGSDATIVNDTHDGVEFDHGHAVVTLRAGYTKTITGLPQGLAYAVTEVVMDDDGNLVVGTPDGFEVSYEGQTETIVEDVTTATVTNTYKASGKTDLTAVKVLEGRPFAAGDEWVFAISASEGAPLPKDTQGNTLTEIAIDPTEGTEAPIDFGTIRYVLADLGGKDSVTFTYTITETTGKDETGNDKVQDVLNDSAKVVAIKVSDNGNGTLDIEKTVDGAAVTADSPITFTNSYQVRETLQATKHLEGRDWKSDAGNGIREQYGFEIISTGNSLRKLEGSPISRVAYTDDATKPAVFGDLVFTAEDAGKVYTYTVREIVPDDAVNEDGMVYGSADLTEGRSGPWSKDGVEYSERQFEVEYAVSIDDKGSLKVDRACSPEADGGIVFTNTYEAKEAMQSINAMKNLAGRQLAAGDFAFRLHDVTRDKEYVARNGYVTTQGGLSVIGGDASAVVFDDIDAFDAVGEYVFTLNEVIPANATTQANGIPVLDGISYDPTTYEVTISVTDDLLGHLVASAPTYRIADSDTVGSTVPPTFNNAYFGAQANISFGKYFYGKDANAKFGFTLEAAEGDAFVPRAQGAGDAIINEATAYGDGNPLVDSGNAFRLSLTNDSGFDEFGHATVSVPTITYHAPGTYRYVITEDGGDGTISDDTAELLVAVTVHEDGTVDPVVYGIRADGQVTLVSAQDAAFYNNGLVSMSFRARALQAYLQVESARVASYMPRVRKVLASGALKGGDFSFTLYNSNGDPLSTVTNDANGTVAFGSLTYTSEDVGKTYIYTISENIGTNEDISYDTHAITLAVQVSEAEDGSIVVTDSYYTTDVETGETVATNDPTIINAYNTIVIHAVKRTREFNEDGTINNNAEGLPGAHYGLWMVNPGGEDIYMGLGRNQLEEAGSELVSDEHGNLYYDIPPIQGVAYYFLEEAPAPEGHLVDPYPTDYFTLVHDDDGFRLVYENDGPDAYGKVFADYVPTLGH